MEKMSKLEEIEIFFEVFVPRASNVTLKSGVLPSPTSFPPQLPPNCVTFPPLKLFYSVLVKDIGKMYIYPQAFYQG